ncbi:MAG: hypothetical protein HY738_03020 [Bacteroidia bacterium]|nr:hypothetical protein [Bacteroidia bacterium]
MIIFVHYKEIDFVLRENHLTSALIQVSYDVGNTKTKTRETIALIEAGKELNCSNLMILTFNYKNSEVIEGKTINYFPVWEWMLFEHQLL